MNDIKIEPNGDGTYDWSFTNDDIENITGNEALSSACTHTVLLRPNELLQDAYQDKGNTAYNYINAKMTENNIQIVEEATSATLEELADVNTADVTAATENNQLTLDVSLITTTGEEVEIDGL